MALLVNEIFRARLNYQDISERNPSWDNLMINDYLGIGQGSLAIVEQIDLNTQAIEVNAENIEILDARVTQNEDDIGQVNDALNAHIGDTSTHGATGNIVGTGDYCELLIGGVVNLMELVSNAVDSTASLTYPDIGVAPLGYDAVYAQEQTDAINDIKSEHNTLVSDLNDAIAQLNDMIAKSKTALQMSSV